MLTILRKIFGPAVNYKSLVDKGAIIIDVRTASEYAAGHIPQSKNVPLERMEQNIAVIKKTGKPVITVCRSGMRSEIAARRLAGYGIEVYNGGAWNSLEKKIK